MQMTSSTDSLYVCSFVKGSQNPYGSVEALTVLSVTVGDVCFKDGRLRDCREMMLVVYCTVEVSSVAEGISSGKGGAIL